MEENMRTFGYLCPKCGQTVIAARSIFALEASNAVIECDCGKSALQVHFDGVRYQLEVPCGLCGQNHIAVCQPKQILTDATALACAKTRQFCCFIGPQNTVQRHLQDLVVFSQKEKQNPDEVFVDSIIMYEILSELKEIAARPDGITCACGSSNYRMEIRSGAVDLICQNCHAKLRLPAATDRDLDDLCCHIKLKIPGQSKNK